MKKVQIMSMDNLWSDQRPAKLALENGSVFTGIGFGADGTAFGEVVFNTSMTGYQEILTDPSYCGQIVTMTCPEIGNVGTNSEDLENLALFKVDLLDLPALLPDTADMLEGDDMTT